METVALLIVIGLALLLVETFIPGMIAGIIGFFCLLSAVVFGYLKFGARTGNLILLGMIVGLISGTLCWIKYFPQSPVAKLFVSKQTVGELGVERPELLNKSGVTLTRLRPSGTALINGKRVDVVTEGALIEKGAPIKVIAIEGMRVVVRAV